MPDTRRYDRDWLKHRNYTTHLFMDDPTDCAFLLSKEGQQSLVDLHVDGVCAYLEND